ncbi:MAG: hypothetical protein Q8Q01_05660 [archaeon]|nr:hypothetical protein [archaeon]
MNGIDDNEIKRLHDEIIENILPEIRESIYTIIEKRTNDLITIESLLEELFSFIDHDGARFEFKKLNTYYNQLDQIRADYYWNQYDDYMLNRDGDLSI